MAAAALTPANLRPTAFKKGQSGNPGGLSKERFSYIQEAIDKAAKLCPIVIDKLGRAVTDNETISREKFYVMREILDRGMGRPAQIIVNHNVEQSEGIAPKDMKTDQLQLLMAGKLEEFFSSMFEGGQLEDVYMKLKEKRDQAQAAMEEKIDRLGGGKADAHNNTDNTASSGASTVMEPNLFGPTL